MLADTPVIPDPVLYHDWHVIARANDIQRNQLVSVDLLGEQILLWRCNQTILAWQDRCPHRGVPLSKGWIEQSDQGDRVVCPYHGFEFNGDGHCIHVPANPHATPPKNSSVRTYAVQERYGYIWIALAEPRHDIPTFWEWEHPEFVHFNCGPYVIHASPLRIVENFTDFAHLPYTHPDLLGTATHPEISDYTVTVNDEGVTAHNVQIYQPNPEGTGSAKYVSYVCQIRRPLMAYFTKEDECSSRFSMFLVVTPVAELRSIAWLGVCRNYALDTPNAELEAFQNHLMSQDIPMLESQRPQRLPLDLQAEFHIPADKLSVTYRKWLKQLGLTFGAC